MQRKFHRLTSIPLLACALALAGCGGADVVQNAAQPASSGTSSATSTSSTGVPANSPPQISGLPPLTATSGSAYSFTPTAVDPDHNTLTFSATGLPAWLTLDTATGQIAGVPRDIDVGETANIVLSVSDGLASAALGPFQIAVALSPASVQTPAPAPSGSANQPPQIGGQPATTVQATRAYSFQPQASDPEGAALTFSVSNKPAWAAFSTTTGQLSGTPAANQTGTYSNIVIRASDGSLSAALPAFTLTVTAAPVNTPPLISGSPATSVVAGTAYNFVPTASDPDGQTLRFIMFNKPDWGVFDTSTGRLSGTPSLAQVGVRPDVYLGVTDGIDTTWLPLFSITVTDPAAKGTTTGSGSTAATGTNQAPTISGQPATSVTAGSSYLFQPSAADPAGSALSFSISGKPAWATFSTVTGALSGSPTTAQVGNYANIVIAVSNGALTTSLASFSINVTSATASAAPVSPPATGVATLTWVAPTQNSDGSALTNLAGFRVYHGTSAGSLSYAYDVPGAGATTYQYGSLASGTHYFAVSAYTSAGIEGALSAVGSKTIP